MKVWKIKAKDGNKYICDKVSHLEGVDPALVDSITVADMTEDEYKNVTTGQAPYAFFNSASQRTRQNPTRRQGDKTEEVTR